MQACNRIAEWRKSNSESKKHPAVGTGCHRYSLDISCVYLTRADHAVPPAVLPAIAGKCVPGQPAPDPERADGDGLDGS